MGDNFNFVNERYEVDIHKTLRIHFSKPENMNLRVFFLLRKLSNIEDFIPKRFSQRPAHFERRV